MLLEEKGKTHQYTWQEALHQQGFIAFPVAAFNT